MKLKSFIKQLFIKDNKKIIEKCRPFSVISFDIFDTLLVRDVVYPNQIFNIVEEEYNAITGKRSEFAKKRVDAEKKARLLAIEEVNLKDIYDCLDDFSREEKETLQILELEIEKKFLHANIEMKEVYHWCQYNGKKIIITSDMYLPKNFLEDILQTNGYSGYVKLFLSNEYGKTKSFGTLYDEVNREFGAEKILHIGDRLIGDFLNPRKKGIHAVLISSGIYKTTYYNKKYYAQMTQVEKLHYDLMYAFINNHLNNAFDDYQRFGYEVIGPILYGFAEWLEKKRLIDNVEKLFFLSREGKLLEKAYKLVNPKSDARCTYIRVSRFATCIPLLNQIQTLDELRKTVYYPKAGSIKDLLLSCDFNEYEIEKICENCTFTSDRIVLDMNKIESENLFDIIKPLLVEKSLAQYDLIKGYLEQMQFNGKCGIVDVGWKGTIQNNLEKLFPQNTIHGYYVGLRRDSAAVQNSSTLRHGYLFGDKSNVTEIQRRLSSTLSVFESFFLSVDGTTIRYQKKGNLFEAVQLDPEQQKDSAENILSIQHGAIEFVKDFSKHNANYSITGRMAFAAYDKFAVTPTRKTIAFLKNFKCINTKEYSLVSQNNIMFYLFHIRQFYKDFMNNTCKVIFMKSIFIIPLPYYEIWKLMHKMERNPINPIH